MSARSKPIRPQRAAHAKTHKQRLALRAQGLIPVEVWTYELTPEFLARLKSDSLRLRNSPDEQAVMDELEALAADLDLGGIPLTSDPSE